MYNGQSEYVPYKKRTKRWLNDHRMHMRYCSGNSVTCHAVDRLQLRLNGHQRIHIGYLQDATRMRTGFTAREPDNPHTNA